MRKNSYLESIKSKGKKRVSGTGWTEKNKESHVEKDTKTRFLKIRKEGKKREEYILYIVLNNNKKFNV